MNKGGKVFNSVSGRPKSFANVNMVQSIHVEDQEKNLPPFKERVHLWTTVRELKDKIFKTTGYPVQRQRLFYNNNELDNSKTLDFYNLLSKKNGSEFMNLIYIVVTLRLKPEIDQMNSYIDIYGSLQCPKKLKDAIDKIRQGFNSGLIPKLTDDGTSGAYQLRNIMKINIAIFKPIDEEPFAPNNPRGHQGPFGSQTFRPGVLSGESCIREVAAYLLDHKHFSGVPQTTFVEVVHQSLKYVPFTGLEVTSDYYFDILSSLIKPVNQSDSKDQRKDELAITNTPQSEASTLANSRINSHLIETVTKRISDETQIGMKFGSLQAFCDNEGPIENFSPDLFHKDEVHKIAILDLRLLNIDRNECNILVKTKTIKKTGKRVKTLVPIDHGLCIPDNLSVCSFDLAWLSWRQAELPFSRRSIQFIESLDIMKDIQILEQSFKFRPICLRNIRISSTLLQRGAKAGLNLAQIGQILCRPDEDDTQPSLLERIVEKSRLIADMMNRMQTKIKDTNLRSIDTAYVLQNFKKDSDEDSKDNEFDESPCSVGKRNYRTNSMSGISLVGISGKTQQNKNQLFSSITAAIGAEDNQKYKVEAKQRGMSDVDDSNIKTLKDNTYNMIDAQVQKLRLTTKVSHEYDISTSPMKAQLQQELEYKEEVSPFSEERKSNGEQEHNNNDDEFFECFDDKNDLKVLEEQMHGRDRLKSDNYGLKSSSTQMSNGLRRTASYSNIQIQEAANEDEEEDDISKNGKPNNGMSPEKEKSYKLRELANHDKFSRGMTLINSTRGPKNYFDQGSVRNTAHDEEFFHCFVQYLDEAIKKMKEQGFSGENDEEENEELEEIVD